jgi:hypothetical protein
MRLSALFEEFTQYLKVKRGASHRSIDTYRHGAQDRGGLACVANGCLDAVPTTKPS